MTHSLSRMRGLLNETDEVDKHLLGVPVAIHITGFLA